MPSVSESQHNLMEAAAHGAKFAKAKKIPRKVAKEFVAADKGESHKLSSNFKHMKNGSKPVTHKDVSRGFTRKKI